MKDKDIRNIILGFSISTILFFGYYFFFNPFKFQLIYQSWDTPSYVIVAKSFYIPALVELANTVRLPTAYFTAHFPLYPFFIGLFSFVGYFRSAIIVSQVFTLLYFIALYFLIKNIYPKVKLGYVILPMILFTPRWFSVSHIGSSEPILLFFITLSLLFLRKEKYLLSATMAVLAQLTKAYSIFLFFGIALYFLYQLFFIKKENFTQLAKKFWPFSLIPLTLFLIFAYFYYLYPDFSFLFIQQKNVGYFAFPPFNIFNSIKSNVIWQEGFVYTFIIYLGTVIMLFKKKIYDLAFIGLGLFLPLTMLVHEDLSRHALIMLPLVFIAFEKIVTNKYFQLSLILLYPAIFLYATTFINYNISP